MLNYAVDPNTVGYQLQNVAQRRQEKVFICFREERITYGETDRKANQLANGLHEIGLSKGDRVGVLLPNCPDYVFTQFGTAKGGIIQVPINTEARGSLLAHFINNSDTAAIIVDEQFLPLIKSVEHNLTRLPKLIIRSGGPRLPAVSFNGNPDIISYNDLFSASAKPPQAQVRYYDPVAIFYTSGTTGVSKGVVLPHNHHCHLAALIVRDGRMTSDDIVYSPFPYYHGLAQFMSTLPALLAEGSVVIAERFSASRFWEEIRRYRATVFYAIYTVPSALIKQPERPDDGEHTLRVFFVPGIDPRIWEAFEKRFKVKVIVGYGSTEQNSISKTPYDEKAKIGSSGKIRPDFEVAIVDDQDNVLPPGKIGEIVSRPKRPYTQMMGYHNMPEETLNVFRNLWLHSGDLGYIDEDGWLYFVGRAKDAMRRRGENISAVEVESIIDSHPAVRESSAIAVPSELGEDEIKVDVVLKPGEALLPQEFIAFCEEKMAKYMVPRYVQFRESLPKTPTERVQKVKLKQEGLNRDTWDRVQGKFIRELEAAQE